MLMTGCINRKLLRKNIAVNCNLYYLLITSVYTSECRQFFNSLSYVETNTVIYSGTINSGDHEGRFLNMYLQKFLY